MKNLDLKKLTINRLLINENESEGLYIEYIENYKNAGENDDFNIFLFEYYKDLGNDFDNDFINIENKIIDNIKNNINYLD